MATERQIESNRRNAARSTGPKTEAGKARSRANATRHGLAGESADVEMGLSAEFEGRRAMWAAEQKPVGEAAGWALDRAVAASLRIERCERAMEEVTATARERARLAWDQDRAVEAATVAARLAEDPALVSRQLQASLAGVGLLVEAWLGLAATLDAGGDWSESEALRALDLLGVAADLRSGPTPIDGPDGADPVAFRRALAIEELDRLEALRDEAMIPLDEMERRLAITGDVALLSKSANLVLRYERDAWRRYRESIREVQAPAPPPVVVAPVPAPAPAPTPASLRRPEVHERAVAHSSSFEEERRALLEAAAPLRSGVIDRLVSMGLDDESAWIEELERRNEARGPARPLATERTRSGGTPVNPGTSPENRQEAKSATDGTRIEHG
jgi:hypothetical protein